MADLSFNNWNPEYIPGIPGVYNASCVTSLFVCPSGAPELRKRILVVCAVDASIYVIGSVDGALVSARVASNVDLPVACFNTAPTFQCGSTRSASHATATGVMGIQSSVAFRTANDEVSVIVGRVPLLSDDDDGGASPAAGVASPSGSESSTVSAADLVVFSIRPLEALALVVEQKGAESGRRTKYLGRYFFASEHVTRLFLFTEENVQTFLRDYDESPKDLLMLCSTTSVDAAADNLAPLFLLQPATSTRARGKKCPLVCVAISPTTGVLSVRGARSMQDDVGGRHSGRMSGTLNSTSISGSPADMGVLDGFLSDGVGTWLAAHLSALARTLKDLGQPLSVLRFFQDTAAGGDGSRGSATSTASVIMCAGTVGGAVIIGRPLKESLEDTHTSLPTAHEAADSDGGEPSSSSVVAVEVVLHCMGPVSDAKFFAVRPSSHGTLLEPRVMRSDVRSTALDDKLWDAKRMALRGDRGRHPSTLSSNSSCIDVTSLSTTTTTSTDTHDSILRVVILDMIGRAIVVTIRALSAPSRAQGSPNQAPFDITYMHDGLEEVPQGLAAAEPPNPPAPTPTLPPSGLAAGGAPSAASTDSVGFLSTLSSPNNKNISTPTNTSQWLKGKLLRGMRSSSKSLNNLALGLDNADQISVASTARASDAGTETSKSSVAPPPPPPPPKPRATASLPSRHITEESIIVRAEPGCGTLIGRGPLSVLVLKDAATASPLVLVGTIGRLLVMCRPDPCGPLPPAMLSAPAASVAATRASLDHSHSPHPTGVATSVESQSSTSPPIAPPGSGSLRPAIDGRAASLVLQRHASLACALPKGEKEDWCTAAFSAVSYLHASSPVHYMECVEFGLDEQPPMLFMAGFSHVAVAPINPRAGNIFEERLQLLERLAARSSLMS